MRKILNFFPKVFCFNEFDIDNKTIKLLIKNAKKCDYEKSGRDEPSSLSLASSNKYFLNQKSLLFLKENLEKDFNSFAKDVLKYNNVFKITTSWITKTESKEVSQWHNHLNCLYSGILYLQTDKDTGKIVFNKFDTKGIYLEPTEWNNLNSNEMKILPKNKMLIYFPSEIYHKIEENKSNITRYSLAFNFMPTGKIGFSESELTV